MREKTCCFTGHRSLPAREQKEIAAKLEQVVTDLINRGIKFYGVGGARGFDTLAAQTILNLKTNYPFIRLILVLPCLTQSQGWRPKGVAEYERIKAPLIK